MFCVLVADTLLTRSISKYVPLKFSAPTCVAHVLMNRSNITLFQGPLAIKMAKHAIDHGLEGDLASGLDVEEDCYEKLLHTNDRLEGLAAFAEKRKPMYKGE